MVKTTMGEKMGNPSHPGERCYGNRFCISTTTPTCGKLLWINLWRLWKTASYQQVFSRFPPAGQVVEKCV